MWESSPEQNSSRRGREEEEEEEKEARKEKKGRMSGEVAIADERDEFNVDAI